jgi:hypothetical protein
LCSRIAHDGLVSTAVDLRRIAFLIGYQRMQDLRSRAEIFVNGAYPLVERETVRLISRYVAGEPFDVDIRVRLSHCLQRAKTKAAGPEGAMGPARDAWFFYQRAASILQEIQDELPPGSD